MQSHGRDETARRWFGRWDGKLTEVDDFIARKCRGDKRAVFRQFLVDEFNFSAVLKCLDPLFAWDFRIFKRDECKSREYAGVKLEDDNCPTKGHSERLLVTTRIIGNNATS
jgi:hypothetical protein